MDKIILLIAVLVCPITMGTMMFFMMRGQKKNRSGTKDADKTR